MAAADYDRAYRPYAAPAPAPAGEYDRPYRNEVVPYGDRRLDIVVKPPARSPPPPLPVSTRSGGGGGAGSAWCFSDPEMKRRRRVASYKAYSVEGKVKASFRRGFRWIKAKCSELIHGWYGSRLLLLPPSPFIGSSVLLLNILGHLTATAGCFGSRAWVLSFPWVMGCAQQVQALIFILLFAWTIGTIDCHCPCAPRRPIIHRCFLKWLEKSQVHGTDL